MDTRSGSILVIFLGVVLLILVYLLPAILGYLLGHAHPVALLVTNVFLGWTIIGWIGCLVWSLWQSSNDDHFDDEAPHGRVEPTL
ncbi:superinfection immunity protein [Acidithiobacillus sp. CV18-2]|nr:superinfection immunity protein [Acidithiobacillus sp. CV18-3]MBU2756892.1 superinfection immunity protein [Acidithiobacillus sp. BN09-2]MBU2778010.1 superinfection immunity protein [Acidithiobacillus sp. CV18-2]MBU2799603.1 superinfection immunity protein [Acidithiobacillus sp. VAN18-4]